MKKEFKILEDASNSYYNNQKIQILTDNEYDYIFDKLKKEDPTNSFFTKVGSKITKTHWKKSKHEFKVGSQSKVNTISELKKWIEKQDTDNFIMQEKLDGISIILTFENGTLIKSVTRGDGEVGEDILRNVKNMDVPLNLINKKSVTIRGEIVLTKSKFKELIKIENFKNPRNAASGISKRLDGKNSNFLTIIVYDILDKNLFNTETEKIKFLEENNFNVVKTYYNPEDFTTIYEDYINVNRKTLDWDIDGLVIKTDLINKNDEWQKPKNQVAWKFPNKLKISKIKDIEWNVSGKRITPIAIFEPINFDDCTVSRASLSNYSNALKLKVGINSEVIVSRRNDVIPQIDKVLIEGEIIKIPKECPNCKGNIGFDTNSEDKESKILVCLNNECSSKKIRQIEKWLITHNIKGVSFETINSLFENNIISDLITFLNLPNNSTKLEILKNLKGFGSKKVKIITECIKKSLNSETLLILGSLDLDKIGKRMILKVFDFMLENTDLTEIYPIDFLNFIISNKDEFLNRNIKNFGNERKNTLYNDLLSKKKLLTDILKIENLKVSPFKKIVNKFAALENLRFCITGKLNNFKRKELEQIIIEHSGKISGVNNSLSYLINNDKTGTSSKNKKALLLNIPIISEEEFFNKFINK